MADNGDRQIDGEKERQTVKDRDRRTHIERGIGFIQNSKKKTGEVRHPGNYVFL